MRRALLSIAGAAFALNRVVHGLSGTNVAKVDAKADAQIHLYPFTSNDCTGAPYGSPIELKQGQCVNFHQSLSVKPRFRSDHADWVDEVNALQTHCKLETFSAMGCLERNKTDRYLFGRNGDLPKDFERCLVSQRQHYQHSIGYDSTSEGSSDDEHPHLHDLYSARFVCGKLENPEFLCTSTVEHTSWSLDPTYGVPNSSVHTATYTGTLSATSQVAARSVPTLEPRGFKPGRETKSVWMLHPWSHSLACYLCYPKKEHDYRKIECRHGIDYPADCGGSPLGYDGKPTTAHTTTTSTMEATTTTHTTTMTAYSKSQGADDLDTSSSDTESEQDFQHLDLELSQKKSWHTPVKFGHPFISGKYACADAEWEKRGRPESYIKIQHVHLCDDKDRKDSQWIGLPETVVHTMNKTMTTTHTIMHTRRHDQL